MKTKAQSGIPMWIVFLMIALIVLVIVIVIISGAGDRLAGVEFFQ